MSRFRPAAPCLLAPCVLGLGLLAAAAPASATPGIAAVFGYLQVPQGGPGVFPQWVRALERHLRDDLKDGDCGPGQLNRCHLAEWLAFLESVRDQPGRRQLELVNRYANSRDYVLDRDNYGVEDYWAIPREFLANHGDCEDFAITKFLSLRWLGYPREALRIVVVQDTNLRVPHAVLAVASGSDVLILDNQVEAVVAQEDLVHYAPVYSLNEQAWWLHLPR